MIATAGPSAYWYLSRGTGAVTLLALTISVVLGILHADRRRPGGSPRLLIESAHRTVSLLVVAMVGLHVLSSVLDSFAPIRLFDAVLPFTSRYRPLWVGFGAVAFDLLIALILTSVFRARLGFRSWRRVHWLAYACWPVALLHGAGTGSDAKSPWMMALTVGCIAAVLAAGRARLAGAHRVRGPARAWIMSGAVVAAAAFSVWMVQGPLAKGWSRRAGTPPRLLASAVASRGTHAPQPPPAVSGAPLGEAFVASLTGVAHQGLSAGRVAVIDLSMKLPQSGGALRVRLAGDPIQGGGVSMTSSAVTLIRGAVYQGRIASLSGTNVQALVGAADGRALRLNIKLALNGSSVTGSVEGRPVTPGTA